MPRIPEAAPTPSAAVTPSTIVPVVDLDDVEASVQSLPLATSNVPPMEEPVLAVPAMQSPAPGASTTVAGPSTSTPNAPAPDQLVDDSLLSPDSWLLRTGSGGAPLFEVVPPTDVKYLKKRLSPIGVHRDMMHYMAKVGVLVVFFSLICLHLFGINLSYVSLRQTVALMATSIERYKHCEQVRDNNLDRLAKLHNDYLAFKEEAKSRVVGLEKRLQLSEEGRSDLARKASEREAYVESLEARLHDSEAEISCVNNDLITERNRRARVESDLKVALEAAKKAEETISARVRAELDLEREKTRLEMRENASRDPEVAYLALDAFGLVKADFFWEGWEEFKELASEKFSGLDFSSLRPRGLILWKRRKIRSSKWQGRPLWCPREWVL